MQSVDETAGIPPVESAVVDSAIDREVEANRRAERIRESLDLEMRDVKDGVLRMGSYVEEQILAAHDAIMCRDAELAQQGHRVGRPRQRGPAGRHRASWR